MNMNISEALSKLENEKHAIRKIMLDMDEEVRKATGGLLSVCSNAIEQVQLFHHTGVGSVQQAIDTIKDMADDAAIEVGWEDKAQVCYRFKIDRSDVCIVLDKEDNND